MYSPANYHHRDWQELSFSERKAIYQYAKAQRDIKDSTPEHPNATHYYKSKPITSLPPSSTLLPLRYQSESLVIDYALVDANLYDILSHRAWYVGSTTTPIPPRFIIRAEVTKFNRTKLQNIMISLNRVVMLLNLYEPDERLDLILDDERLITELKTIGRLKFENGWHLDCRISNIDGKVSPRTIANRERFIHRTIEYDAANLERTLNLEQITTQHEAETQESLKKILPQLQQIKPNEHLLNDLMEIKKASEETPKISPSVPPSIPLPVPPEDIENQNS